MKIVTYLEKVQYAIAGISFTLTTFALNIRNQKLISYALAFRMKPQMLQNYFQCQFLVYHIFHPICFLVSDKSLWDLATSLIKSCLTTAFLKQDFSLILTIYKYTEMANTYLFTSIGVASIIFKHTESKCTYVLIYRVKQWDFHGETQKLLLKCLSSM